MFETRLPERHLQIILMFKTEKIEIIFVGICILSLLCQELGMLRDGQASQCLLDHPNQTGSEQIEGKIIMTVLESSF